MVDKMKPKLMNVDGITAINNVREKNHELVNFLYSKSWNIEEVLVLWRTAEIKIHNFNI